MTIMNLTKERKGKKYLEEMSTLCCWYFKENSIVVIGKQIDPFLESSWNCKSARMEALCVSFMHRQTPLQMQLIK